MSRKMNRIRKEMVVASLLLSVILIITVVFYLRGYMTSSSGRAAAESGQGFFENPTYITAGVIVTLAVVTFGFVVYRSIKKNRDVSKLNEAYDLVYEQVQQYLGLSGLSFTEQKELSSEILSLFLEAQQDGKKVEQVIGEDYRVFMDDLLSAYGIKSYFLHDLFTGLQSLICYFIAAQALMTFETGGSFFEAEIDYTTIFFFVLLSFVVIPAVYNGRRGALKHKKNQTPEKQFSISMAQRMLIFPIVIGGLFIGFIELLTRYFSDVPWVNYFLYQGVAPISSPIILTACIFIVLFLFYVKRRMRKA